MPTYNEAGNIIELIKRTNKALKNGFEIIVVDDNSPDGTAQVVRKFQKGRPFLKLIVRKNKPRSLPLTIKQGIDEAKGETVAWLDCDLSMPPEKLAEMIKLLDKNDIVIGSTFIKGAKDSRNKFHSQLFSRLINWLAQLILGNELTDYTSGFIVAHKKAIEGTRFEGYHGAYFIDLLYRAKRKGYQIAEVPYTLAPRGYGKTKIVIFWPYLKTGLYYLWVLLKTRFIS
jgi:dolichol-phosphate mannosyltransferase